MRLTTARMLQRDGAAVDQQSRPIESRVPVRKQLTRPGVEALGVFEHLVGCGLFPLTSHAASKSSVTDTLMRLLSSGAGTSGKSCIVIVAPRLDRKSTR